MVLKYEKIWSIATTRLDIGYSSSLMAIETIE